MLFYTDTHAHIHAKEMRNSVRSVLKNSYESNVKRIFAIGTDLRDSKKAVEFAERYDGIYASVGVHPHYADNFSLAELGELEKLAFSRKVVAIGEVGLDFYRNRSTKEKQTEVFSLMVDMAVAADLPLIIHSRNASLDICRQLEHMLKDIDHKVLFHCFSGEQDAIKWGLGRRNVMFSFAGNVTYSKAFELHEALACLPIQRIFIETDCPYLAPSIYRGKPNEPAYIVETGKFVAKHKKLTEEELQKELEENFIRFFGEKTTLNKKQF